MTVLEGVVNHIMIESLSRSLVGETLVSIDIKEISKRLMQEFSSIMSVKAMGSYKVLITFQSIKDMEDMLLMDNMVLLNQLEDIRKWTQEEFCRTRRTWVECFGIPPHA